MKIFILLVAFAICLAACKDNSVPYVKDAKNVVVDGKPVEQGVFIERYCIGKPNNETCIKVQNARSAADVRSKTGIPRF